MPIGLIGKKLGMTRVFTEAGTSVPVTVIHAPANYVSQVKTPDSDGYLALQMTVGAPTRVGKPMSGHFKRAGVEAGRSVREFRIVEEELRNNGDRVNVASFSVGEKVNVIGTSKGKGFAGVIKRHHFRSQDATHGNSLSHRAAGSIGQCQTPGRVFKGKKMAGHLGGERVTIRNLTVVQVDAERELLLLEGAVPGARNSEVVVDHQVPVPPEQSAEKAEEQVSEQTPDGEATTEVVTKTEEAIREDESEVRDKTPDVPDVEERE